METPSFLIDAIINEVQCEEVLVDNGCQSYASVNDDFVMKHNPQTVNIPARKMEGFRPGVYSTITKAAKFCVDLAGLKRIYGYMSCRTKLRE